MYMSIAEYLIEMILTEYQSQRYLNAFLPDVAIVFQSSGSSKEAALGEVDQIFRIHLL